MGRPSASARQAWAVEQLDVQPEDRVLELGCGHGVAVSLICERLAGGTVVAIDRSATMTAAATKRNAQYVESGRAMILTATLQGADLGDAQFNKVLAVHYPPLQRGDAARELAKLREHLSREGALYVVAAPIASDEAPAAKTIVSRLSPHGFVADPPRIADVDGQRMVCVVAHDVDPDLTVSPQRRPG
jgi:cyclopropane fatty-acyl-phospholipid synthase-like methyltransferase